MSKKDYEKFARMIKAMGKGSNWSAYDFALMVADILKEDNPRFDHVRFMTACGFWKDGTQ